MDGNLAPFIDIQILWAARHHWPAGTRQTRTPPGVNLWLVKQGEIDLTVAGKSWQVEPGQAILTPPGVEREIYTPRGASWLSLTFRATHFVQFDATQGWQLPFKFAPEDAQRDLLNLSLSRIVELWNSEATAASVEADGFARVVFAHCWRVCGSTNWPSLDSQNGLWIGQVLRHLRERPGTDVAEWAKSSGYSPAQFRRKFRAIFQCSPQEYLVRHRLEGARIKLRNSDESVATIGRELGFSNHSHFTRAFRQRYGLAPAEFRVQSRE